MSPLPIQRKNFTFTSESVSEGHPDKLCDQVSDTILDYFLAQNPEARVAAETLATTNRIVIAGEIRGGDLRYSEVEERIRNLVHDIGYEQKGFDWRKINIEILLHEQSSDIAQGVDSAENKDEGAGDQGIMFGFACNETDTFMPAAIHYSHRVLKAMADARKADSNSILRPDSKSQISLRYEDGKPVGVSSLVVSTQHTPEASQEELREVIRQHVNETIPEGWMCGEDEFYTNPTGQFIIGGPDGDAGLTGRKIIVDTYGGAAPHGGGAFSGKDPTKVDRSAAYAARYLAKNVVASGVADRCTIQLSYAIGVSHPISLYVSTAGSGKVDDRELEKFLPQLMNLTPRGIREHLQLNRPIYLSSAAYGHFGREPNEKGEFSWEKLDLVDAIQRHFGNVSKQTA